jgi:hypothetical protein
VIFSRGRGGSGKHARSGRRDGDPQDVHIDDESGPAVPARGPFDVSEAPEGVQRLDLGSLQIPAIQDVEVRVQANPDGEIQQVVLVWGENALQLGVFAAPRSEGIWDEVREEIRSSLFAEGVAAKETQGDYGVELLARVTTPDGLTDLRFLGIDGPRWMVRGVYQGPAATNPAAAGLLIECLDGLVVDRGNEAKPVREPLPLRLPREAGDQLDQEGIQAPGVTTVRSADGAGPDGSQVNGAGPGTPHQHRDRPSPRPRGSA